jgi:hypothetical protein
LQIYRIIAICTDKDYNFDPSDESNVGFVNNVIASAEMNAMLGEAEFEIKS